MVTSPLATLSRRIIISYLLIINIFIFASPIYACHQPGQPIPSGQPNHNPGEPSNPQMGPCPAGLKEIEGVFSNVISVIVGLGFVAMLVMLVMGGIKYLTSAGEPKAVQSAHQTVTWALLGVVFMAIAWLVLQLIHTFTGISVTIFNIKVLL